MAEPVATEKMATNVPVNLFGPASMTVTATGEDHLHELRVRIPVDLHRQLLSLKVLRGKSLAESVSAALEVYFEEHARTIAQTREQ